MCGYRLNSSTVRSYTSPGGADYIMKGACVIKEGACVVSLLSHFWFDRSVRHHCKSQPVLKGEAAWACDRVLPPRLLQRYENNLVYIQAMFSKTRPWFTAATCCTAHVLQGQLHWPVLACRQKGGPDMLCLQPLPKGQLAEQLQPTSFAFQNGCMDLMYDGWI